MVSVCFYFQVHQPIRLRNYSVFEIGKNSRYFDESKNKAIVEKVAKKCYYPTNRLILQLIEETDGAFRVSYSITGVALEQFERYEPKIIESFQRLAETGCVEFLSETYYHSLAYLYSKPEFFEQVKLQEKLVEEYFGQKPKVFRNTELIYNNQLAADIEKLGYKAIVSEGADHVLGWRSPNFVYKAKGTNKLALLVKNYRLSDDIAFRFSNRAWKEWPLTSEKFAKWINAINGNGECVNIFIDYETFGEHHWAPTGIFRFLKHLPGEILKHKDNNFMTPSELISSYPVRDAIDVPEFISWADIERDLSAWLGNKMQQSAIHELYKLEKEIKQSKDAGLIEDWRKLQTSDHFYYMCTKWFSDGDVHKYFNPYETPYDGFIAFMNVLNDLRNRLKSINAPAVKVSGEVKKGGYVKNRNV